MANDPVVTSYHLLPYLDFSDRLSTISAADYNVGITYQQQANSTNYRIRAGYWYDLQQAGASQYSGSNSLTFASSSNKYGFPYAVTLSVTVPQNQSYAVYGVADYAANPALQAFQISQQNVEFPLVYISPDLYNTNGDHKAVLNGSFPGVKQGQNITISLYGTAAQTDPVDILFELAEAGAVPS